MTAVPMLTGGHRLPAIVKVTHTEVTSHSAYVITVANGFQHLGPPPSSSVIEGELEGAEPWEHTS